MPDLIPSKQEMRYLWNTPHTQSPSKFERLVPEFSATAVETSLVSALPADVNPNQPVARTALRA